MIPILEVCISLIVNNLTVFVLSILKILFQSLFALLICYFAFTGYPDYSQQPYPYPDNDYAYYYDQF